MRILFVFIAILFSSFTIADTNKILVEIYGDLDKDKIEEKITVTELNEDGDDGKIRLLEIFKKNDRNWKLICSSKTAILQTKLEE